MKQAGKNAGKHPGDTLVRAYEPADAPACLALFDRNCPAAFAPNERADYAAFLAGAPAGYEVFVEDGELVAAYGVRADAAGGRGRVVWILTHPERAGRGLGRRMMERALERARAAAIEVLDIAASQHSAPFFERFGGRSTGHTADGWGPGMHRVDMELPVGG